MLTVVPGVADADDRRPAGGADSSSLIDEIVREGARQMLAEALQTEVDAYIAQFRNERDERGHRLVVRNGSHQPREVMTSAGAVEVVAPRVNDRRIDPESGQRLRFSSAILPPWCRKTPKITEVLPPTARPAWRATPRVSAGRMRCPESLAPTRPRIVPQRRGNQLWPNYTAMVACDINDRLRKVRNWKKPSELFTETVESNA